MYRLPQFGKRLYIEVDLLEAPSIKKSDFLEEDEQEREEREVSQACEEYRPAFLQSLGPLAGVAALLWGLAQQTFFVKAGEKHMT